MPVESQTCRKCKEAKGADHFYLTPTGRLSAQCRRCKTQAVVDRQKARYRSDPAFRASKIERVVERQSIRYQTDSKFRTKAIAKVALQQSHRYRSDSSYRISKSFSTSIRSSLKSGKAGAKWEDLVGYNVSELMERIESLFAPGMTWENYGSWHIDHIAPVASFHFSSPQEDSFRACWGLANLQPMWAVENIKKSDKLPSGERARKIKAAGEKNGT